MPYCGECGAKSEKPLVGLVVLQLKRVAGSLKFRGKGGQPVELCGVCLKNAYKELKRLVNE
jgi:hypothetical protein